MLAHSQQLLRMEASLYHSVGSVAASRLWADYRGSFSTAARARQLLISGLPTEHPDLQRLGKSRHVWGRGLATETPDIA